MNDLRPTRSVWADTRGQAITEFAIIMPIVLLFFLAILQYLQVFRASQHVNYAAYAAARSYAVHASVDGTEEATRVALDAAALALAPVARAAPREFFGVSSFTSDGSRVLALLEGFLTARYVRLNPDLGGGSLNISRTRFASGAPVQVNVEINYPQPIYIPGLAELWNYVGRGSEIGADLSDLNDGLFGPIAIPDRIIESFPSELRQVFPGIVDAARTYIYSVTRRFMYPYINVRGKCAIGYSDWGRKNGRLHRDYQPRFRALEGDVSKETPSDQGRDFAQEAEDYKSDKADIERLGNEAKKACSELRAAQSNLDQAQRTYDATPNNPADAKRRALERRNAAQTRLEAAQIGFNQANGRLQDVVDRLEGAANTDFPTTPCDP
jgi:Flp pilus assembly protein TadG